MVPTAKDIQKGEVLCKVVSKLQRNSFYKMWCVAQAAAMHFNAHVNQKPVFFLKWSELSDAPCDISQSLM